MKIISFLSCILIHLSLFGTVYSSSVLKSATFSYQTKLGYKQNYLVQVSENNIFINGKFIDENIMLAALPQLSIIFNKQNLVEELNCYAGRFTLDIRSMTEKERRVSGCLESEQFVSFLKQFRILDELANQ